MSGLDPLGAEVEGAFATAPKLVRAHVGGRLRSCPSDALHDATPASGNVLDIGCGHGAISLYLALAAPDRRITGIDVDVEKLTYARAAAAQTQAEITFDAVPVGFQPVGTWDAITIVDVLYLLGKRVASDLLDAAAAALAPGGSLVVKEVDVRPRAKFWFAAAQEVVATKVLRITKSTHLAWLSPEEMGARMTGSGLAVEQRSLGKGRLHPHHIVVGRKPR